MGTKWTIQLSYDEKVVIIYHYDNPTKFIIVIFHCE